MGVLLLMGWLAGLEGGALAAMAAALGGSLVALRLLPEAALSRAWFTSSLFIGDALAATVVLRLTDRGRDLFLLYLFLVFGSALTRSALQRASVAALAVALYLAANWRGGWPADSAFWLRAVFLAVSGALLAVLGRDARQAQEEQARRYEQRLVQVGRLATLGRVAGEVAHRIKGPLTTIAVDAEVLAHRLAGDKKAERELREIVAEVDRCKRILKDLLDLGRIEEMDVASIDVREPLERALDSVRTQARSRRVRVSAAGLDRRMPARADASLLHEAVAALLQNALEAVRDGGRVELTASTSGGLHRVEIADDGAGISRADLERVFEPFFTTKKGRGSGLGLSAALRIAAKHGGTVEAQSDGPGKGARFTLVLPAA